MNPQRAFAEFYQPDLVPTPRAHKRQRSTAREVYRQQRAVDVAKAEAGKETREGQVLRLLAWHFNATQISPTALELLAWARSKGEHLFDVNSLRPRLKELFDRGLVEPRGKRTCAVSGKTVHTWACREIGSAEAR
jgi:hypothetical protein